MSREVDMEKKSYRYFIGACENCKEGVFVEIPKGTTVEDFMEKEQVGDTCLKCGCKHGIA